MQTKGEYRVGTTFNPSASGLVDEIKRKAADLIDLIDSEVERLSALLERLLAPQPAQPAAWKAAKCAGGAGRSRTWRRSCGVRH